LQNNCQKLLAKELYDSPGKSSTIFFSNGERESETMNDVRLAGFIAAVFPDAQQSICLRAFKAKDAPDDPVIHPLSWQVTKAQLLSPGLQKELFAANETRGIYFVVNSGATKRRHRKIQCVVCRD
jgi:hypothetical protein